MQRSSFPAVMVWAFVPFIATSAAHVALLTVGSPIADTTKLLLMPLLALPVVLSIRRLAPTTVLITLLTALTFSWLGDGAGVFFPMAPELPLMLLFFGIAHVAYIALFARRLTRRRMPWWALLYALWWVAMLVFLGPHTGGLLPAVAAYGLVLAGTAAFASRYHPIIAAGGAFFLASDTVLAFRLFLPNGLPAWSNPVIMLTYTLGQGLIVAGALIAIRERKVG